MITELRLNKIKLGILWLTIAISGQVMAQNTAIQLTEMNLLYKGINNGFKVAVDNVDSKNVVVKTSAGLEIRYIEEESFIMVKRNNEREEFITVGKLIKGDTQWLDTYAYRIRSLPQPTAQLGELANDGLPKKKEDVLEQTELIATMGPNFAYDLPYSITKFKLIIIHKTEPPVLLKGSGGQVTKEMLIALAKASNGDRILIEGIIAVNDKFGFKASLSPIIITIRDAKPNRLMQDRELIYVKIDPDSDGTNAIYTEDIKKETTDSITEGVIDWVFKDDNGFKRERRTYKNGEVTQKDYFDDNGILIYILHSASGSKWRYESFYTNGKKKVECIVDDSIDYIGNTEILDCDNYFSGHYVGQYKWKRCDSIVHLSIETDVHHIKYMYELNPVGYFRSFHSNGEIKYEGTLILGFNSSDTLSSTKKSMSKEYASHFSPYKDISVMDGIWHYFNEDGSLIHTRLYRKGVLFKY
jgi:hypothetical protein